MISEPTKPIQKRPQQPLPVHAFSEFYSMHFYKYGWNHTVNTRYILLGEQIPGTSCFSGPNHRSPHTQGGSSASHENHTYCRILNEKVESSQQPFLG